MSLVPAMNLGIARPTRIVSLNRIEELDYVEESAQSVRIGAMVRHARIASDPLIARSFPLLARAASVIGDIQVRNRGTIGGSIAHADPAADYLPVMLVLGATFRVAGGSGERTVPARDFVLGVMMTDLGSDELLVEIELPKLPAGAGSAYLRLARLEGSFPIANAAAVVDGGAPVVAVGGATGTPLIVDIEEWDGEGSDDARSRVEDAARTAAAPAAFGDLSATVEYRRAMAGVLARRAVEAALTARRGS
jgi:carbon-monoxide dehydrogenase medium subunit